jgi:hypothetical protein
MDLITGLPKIQDKDTVLTIVDYGCSRAAIFLPCATTITSSGIATLYLKNVYPWFGLPKKESSTTSSKESGPIPHSDLSSFRSKGGPCLLGPCKTLSGQMNTSTQSSYGSLSTAWSLPLRATATSTICNASYPRNSGQPSCEQEPQQAHPLSSSNPSLPCLMGTSRIEGRWPLSSLAVMGHNTWPGGSSAWTKGEWPGTPRETPPMTFQSSSTSML